MSGASARLAAVALLWILAVPVSAATSASGLRLADPAVLEALRATDTPGLPRNLTAGERAHLRLQDLSRVPRVAPVAEALNTAAEFERNAAIVMRWGNFNSVLTEMIVPITTGDSLASVLLVVASAAQQSSARLTLSAAGANLDRVAFLIAPSNSVWIRDYGPRFSSADNERIIIDHQYNRPRPQDNQIPAAVAAFLNEDLFAMPLNHGGGNFHLFANGEAFMTDLIVAENPGYTAEDVIDLYAAYQGLDLTLLPALPASFDSTQHLDMWFLPVDDRTVIIGDYSSPPPGVNPVATTATVIEVTEFTAALMAERGYTVLRTPGWRAQGSAHRTYTNAVIVNDLVLICRFNGFEAQNAAARDVFEQAFPDSSLVSVDCSTIINSAGALHCIVKHKPAPTFRLALEQRDAAACVPDAGSTDLSFELAVTGINGFADEVELLSVGEPMGVSSSFSPPELLAPGEATWTINIEAGSQAGASEISLFAVDGFGRGLPFTFSLNLKTAPPGPELANPPDLAENVDLAPVLEWVEVDAAIDYRIQLAADENFKWVVLERFSDGTALSLDEPLAGDRVYYWRVLARSECGEGGWSATRRFQTRSLTEPEVRLFRDRFEPDLED